MNETELLTSWTELPGRKYVGERVSIMSPLQRIKVYSIIVSDRFSSMD